MTTPDRPPCGEHDRDSAFTLIELLTVVAIVGILAAILFPVIGSARASARDAQCKATLREWGRMVLLYANDNKGCYTTTNWGSVGSNGPYRPYFSGSPSEETNMRVCPLMPSADISNGTLSYIMVRGAINGKITSLSSGTSIHLNRAANPSEYLLLCDSMTNSNDYLSSSGIDTYVGPLFNPSLVAASQQAQASRHGGSHINGVFGDGSIHNITGTPAGKGDHNSIYEMSATWLQLY